MSRKIGNNKQLNMHHNPDKGFTLVEMIVVIVVIGIVLSLTVAGLMKWQDWSNFKKEDEYAQTLFLAAQNQLNEYVANGRIEELQNDLAQDEASLNINKGLDITDNVNLLINNKGNHYNLNAIFPNSNGNADLQDRIISLRAETGEYQSYISNPALFRQNNPEGYWVFELLSYYVYDTTILNGSNGNIQNSKAAICIELTPNNGQIFAVLYSDKQDEFYYAGIEGEKTSSEVHKVANIVNRSEVERQKTENMIGYYGVDTLSAVNKNNETDLVADLEYVKLFNEDTFWLATKLSDKSTYKTSPFMYSYELNLVNSANENDKELTVVIPKNSLSNNMASISCNVISYKDNPAGVSYENVKMLAWYDNKLVIHVILDAADIQATDYLYRSNSKEFMNTYSFFKFGVGSGNVYATATAKIENVSSTLVKNFDNLNILLNQNAKNPVFAGVKVNNSNKEFNITNGRHLYNIRYIEDKEPANGETVTFTLKKDIDWQSFQENGNLYASRPNSGFSFDGLRIFELRYNNNTKKVEKTLNTSVSLNSCDFPSIYRFREDDIINGNNKKISGISVSEVSNILYGDYQELQLTGNKGDDSGEKVNPTGFININYGKIKNLRLDKLTAVGKNMVGGVCGVNLGELENVTTLNTDNLSLVSGYENIGGIMGFQYPAKNTNGAGSAHNITISNLINNAPVEGTRAVGGIVGMVRNGDLTNKYKISGLEIGNGGTTKKPKITIANCNNYGSLSAVSSESLIGIYGLPDVSSLTDEEKKIESRYIGGIAGYCYNNHQNNGKIDLDNITITACTSSPQYEEAEIRLILTDENKLAEKLKGAYVGGITGYNYYSNINDCSSVKVNGQPGYIFAYKYAGGIVGFNVGPSNGKASGTGAGTNYNHVIAYEYAGGIVGCNSKVKENDYCDPAVAYNDVISPDNTKTTDIKIENWINKGIVIATNKYAGGITGFNAGWIYGCNTLVDVTKANEYYELLTSGDYVGGITGYNNGVIGNRELNNKATPGAKLSAISYVIGHNYVGGIVGYNDVDSMIEDYQVSGGYVVANADSHFVGGYAGFNASIDLIYDRENKRAREIVANPNKVEGSFFVGGNIGGNIINVNDPAFIGTKTNPARIPVVFKTDSFLGTLKGTAFVGGFIGYNQLIYKNEAASIEPTDKEVYKLQNYLIENINSANHVNNINYLDNLKNNLAANDAYTSAGSTVLFMSGQGASGTRSAFGSITGDVYVAGVIGYNDGDTNLYIQNVENASSIVALKAVANDSEQTYANVKRDKNYSGADFNYTYSYAGGIIGKVSKNTTLDSCFNSFAGKISSKGTYLGGLCEINEGNIINCTVSNFGSGVDDYLGGICGLNKPGGIIEDCSIADKIVTGRNVVGAITAENFGTIKNITLSNASLKVAGIATGDKDGVAGLFAAYNGKTGVIELNNDLVNVNVKSSGKYVGAVAGINEGTIENKKTAATDNTIANNIVISGKVEGLYDVGGLVGKNNDLDMTHKVLHYTNNATIISETGNAGGIIGDNNSNNTIEYCVNNAVVTSTVGNAGGITSKNLGRISNCINYRSVIAPKGMCGGITAINGNESNKDAVIANCIVESLSDTTKIEFESTSSVGGITAVNYALIQDNATTRIKVKNNTLEQNSSIGVFVGENKTTGIIYLKENEASIIDCEAAAMTNYCNVGGVAGINEGLIANKSSYESHSTDFSRNAVIGAAIKLEGAQYGSFGGVAGTNTGIIANCHVETNIDGNLGNESSGYGGIAGFNAYSSKDKYNDAKSARKDDNYKATIIACSFDGNIHANGSGGNAANLGGITGVNGYGGYITGCAIGVRSRDLAGNESVTTRITAGDTSKTVAAPDKASYAFVGGIAGRNYAEIKDIDMKANTVDTTVEVIGFAGSMGGVVGFNYPDALVTGYKDNDGNIHWITTPSSMHVEMRLGENDFGSGGVIGYDRSSLDIEYIKNYASVENMVNLNVKTGGVIGTIEQSHESIVNVSNVYNYGSVRGMKQVGGILGRTKFCTVNMKDCTNYGEVYCQSGIVGGLIGAIYDVRELETYFTHCDNHGHVYTSGTTGAGGILGQFDSTKNVTAYFNDCDNTGVIEKEGATAPVESNKIGDFVGNGAGGGATGSLNYYFDMCQSYGTSKSSNGFVGNGGTVVRITNCLDATGKVTTRKAVSPFIGNTNVSTDTTNFKQDKSTLQNAYYIDRSSNNNLLKVSQDSGAYFSFCRNASKNFYWQGRAFINLNNPALYLETPKSENYILLDNQSLLEMQVSYDDSICKGMEALNIYLFNSKFDDPSFVLTSTITATATFMDENGNKDVVVVDKSNITNVLKDNKLAIPVPSTLSNKIVDIIIKLESVPSAKIFVNGFTYDEIKNNGEVKETAINYIANKYNTTFNIEEVITGTTKRTTATFTNLSGYGSQANGLNDLLGMKFPMNAYFNIKKETNNPLLYEFDVENGKAAPGIDAFVFYPNNNNTSLTATKVRKYMYDYEVTFTDENNIATTVSGRREDNTAAIGLFNGKEESAPVKVMVPDAVDKEKIKHITLKFNASSYVTVDLTNGAESGLTLNQQDIYLRGFGWIPKGSSDIEIMAFGPCSSRDGKNYNTNYSSNKLYCDYSGNGGTTAAPYVYSESNYDAGFVMTANDPSSDAYFDDLDSYNSSNSKADGSNSRIRVYYDLHDKFERMIYKQYSRKEKLATPLPTESESLGKHTITWPSVDNAFEYEVKYVVKDASNKEIYKSDISKVGLGTRVFYMTSKSEWAGCKIDFYVRAVNGYRYENNLKECDYDSDWGTCGIISKTPLPQPRVHMELTSGNRYVAVLENYDDYLLADGSHIDCVIEGCHGTESETFKINVAESFVSKDAYYSSGHNIASDYILLAQAMPNDSIKDYYSESSKLYLRGRFVDNSTLSSLDQYIKAYFRGFYGKEADQMTFDVYCEADNRDCFIKTDIVAYDESLGMNISYANMVTHVAANGGKAYLTSTLSNLPMEIFAEDYVSPILVREYIKKSQYEIVYYEHLVEEGIELDGSDQENKSKLKSIRDPYFLGEGESDVCKIDTPIWDDENDCLLPGYTIEIRYGDNGEKLYDIYYNKTIELATKAAAEQNASLTGAGKYVYYKYGVDYKQYDGNKSEIELVSGNSKISADISQDDYQEAVIVRNIVDKTILADNLPAKNTNVAVLELQPAPIVTKTEENMVNGHHAYKFYFDEYFKDVYCMTENGANKSATWYNKTDDIYLTRADASVAATWNLFLKKSNYENITDRTRKRRIENSYYYTYLGAKYRIDLLGTTLDGEKAVIASKTVDTPTQLDDFFKDYTVGTKAISTTYNRFDYEVEFVDEEDVWKNYSDFSVRIMRLGETDSLANGKSVPDITKFAGYNGSTFRVPRYTEYSIHVLMKLDSINNPSAGLHQDQEGFVTDDLIYDVSFAAITNVRQLEDLGGYLIRARLKTPVGDNYKEHYYYITEDGSSLSDNNLSTTITDLINAKKDIVCIDKEKDYREEENIITASIDLSDYEANDEIEIAVLAFTKLYAKNYIDGEYGSATELTILDRLHVPEIAKLNIVPEEGMDSADITPLVDKETYAKGFYFKYANDSSDTSYQFAKMNMAVALFDASKDLDDITKHPAGDYTVSANASASANAPLWNEYSRKTLYSKAMALDMGYINNEKSKQVDLTSFEDYKGQFAGKWIKIALKASSETSVDSQWTDQDDEEKASINYKWISIPKLDLSDLEMMKDSYSTDTPVKDVVRVIDGKDIRSTTLCFAEEKNLNGYNITVVKKPRALDDRNVLPVYQICIERDVINGQFTGRWNVFIYAVTDGADLDYAKNHQPASAPKCKQNENAYYLGNIGISLPEFGDGHGNTKLIIEDIKEELAGYDMNMELRYLAEDDNPRFLLVLPDISAIDGTEHIDDSNYFTIRDLLVEQYLDEDEEDSANYIIGKSSLFARSSNEGEEGEIIWDSAISKLTESEVDAWKAKILEEADEIKDKELLSLDSAPTSENPASDKIGDEDSASENAVSENSISENSASENAVSDNKVNNDEGTASENKAKAEDDNEGDEAVSENAVSDNKVKEDEESASENSATEESGDEGTASENKAKAEEESGDEGTASENKAKAEEESGDEEAVSENKAKAEEESGDEEAVSENKAKAEEDSGDEESASENKDKADKDAGEGETVSENNADE